MKKLETTTLIVGHGLAGLSLALSLADTMPVMVLAKDDIYHNASSYAQGGIAAVTSDDPEQIAAHIADTTQAGDHLCCPSTVAMVVRYGQQAIQWLHKLGVPFTRQPDNASPHLNIEGGHQHRRIYHVHDHTGLSIMQQLAQRVSAHPNIQMISHCTAIDCLVQDQVCYGALALDTRRNQLIEIRASFTVLATGGASAAYQYHTNPWATGDGIAIGHRAGCLSKHMAFVQFHPTVFWHPHHPPLLISEALRGEGAVLERGDGTAFMHLHHPDADLATRDIVARAIDKEIRSGHSIYLNAQHISEHLLNTHFPRIMQQCQQRGINPCQQRIPITPASHYTCGGLITDQHGQTTIARCFAIGEVSYTGLHGANRLASNSLLECLAFSHRACQWIMGQPSLTQPHSIPITQPRQYFSGNKDRLQRLMQQSAGIVRTHQGLSQAKIILEHQTTITTNNLSTALLDYHNLVTVCQLIVNDAINQPSNLGVHYNSDLSLNKSVAITEKE